MRRHLEHPGRREFLQVLAGAAALAVPRIAGAQSGSSPTSTKLGERVTLISGAGNNVIAFAGDSGSLLVDAGDAAHAANVIKDVLKLAGKVNTVFNTHWHPEQTGSNEGLGMAGATIIAQENTRLWLAGRKTKPAAVSRREVHGTAEQA